MAYVPPHARRTTTKSNANLNSNTNLNANSNTNLNSKVIKKDDFPSLVNNVTNTKSTLNFSNLFKETEEPPKEIKDELKKGYIVLSNKGFRDSLTQEERTIEDNNKLNNKITENMKKMYIYNEKIKQERILYDNEYIPEVVIDEYSSSNYSSSEESEDFAEDPEEESNEL
jgi:hypothetical protein